MRKVVIHAAGGHDKLNVEDHPDPSPKAGEVLVEVEAAGVNFADTVVRMGLYQSAKDFVGWPITPGFEVAGRIVAVGEGSSRFAPGDRVIAVTLFGGYASKLTVPEHQVFACPDGLEAEVGACLPAVFLTAYYALFELCRLRPGDVILVHSAAGGVGGALLQLARHARVRTVGVVGSASKVGAAKRMGADHVIDKRSEKLWARARELAPDGYHAVLDANGAETLAASFAQVRRAGRLVVYGFHTMMPKKGGTPNWLKLGYDFLRTPRFNPFDMVTQNKSVMAFNLSYLFGERELLADAMSLVLTLVEEGKLVQPEVKRYPVDRVADAHRALESGSTVGKLVLTFS